VTQDAFPDGDGCIQRVQVASALIALLVFPSLLKFGEELL
jgi:hypothetical protein